MKQIKLLLLVVLLALIPQASAAFFINQTANTGSLGMSYPSMFGQNFTTPNYPNISQYKLDYIEIFGQTSVIGTTQPIDMQISNKTWHSSNITVTWDNPFRLFRYTFNDVILESGKNDYNFTISSYPGGNQIDVAIQTPSLYSGGNVWADNLPIFTSDLQFNISISPHDNITWAADEGSGAYLNGSISVFNLNGTITGSRAWSTNLQNGSVNGTSMQFDGLTTYVSITNKSGQASDYLNFSYTTPYTLDFWYKTNESPTISGVLISKTSSIAPVAYEIVNYNGHLGWTVMKSTDANKIQVNSTNAVFSANTWYHISAQYDGSSTAAGAKIFVNDVSIPLTVVTDNAIGSTQTSIFLRFGSQDGTQLLNGTLDEISIFNYDLNDTEATNIFKRFQPVPAYPVGNLALSATTISNTISVTFLWYDSVSPMDYVDISLTSGFTSIVASQVTALDSATITLPAGVTYYWRVRQYDPGTGLFGVTSPTQVFRTKLFSGFINVNVVDELTFLPVYSFNATLYNGSVLSKYSGFTKDYVNFTSAEISAGQYQLVISPNSSYAERAIIVTSPGNYTVYLPSTLKTVDFVSFYLLDYSGRFSPYTSVNLTITKGVNITHSQYFDSDTKVATNLIRGEQYTITIYNPSANEVQQWGNYYSVGTGSVQIIIMNIGVNASVLQPYVQQINASSSSIDVSWLDRGSILNWVNISIYKDNVSTMVFNLNTTIGTGSASYLITDANATYITIVNASTTQGLKQDSNIFSSISQATGLIKTWTFGNFQMPDWVKNAFGIVILFMLAGSFGAMHRGEGAVVTGIFGMFLWWYNILSLNGMILTTFGGLCFYAVLYALESKRRQGIY